MTKANEARNQMPVLLARLGSWCCAMPLSCVVETMRPLPVEPAQSGTPPFVLGSAVIRGQSVSVIDLGVLTGRPGDAPAGRFVLLRSEEQMLALAVDQLLGVFPIDHAILEALPPVLDAADVASIAETGVVEKQLLGALQAMKVLSEAVLATFELSGEGA